MSISTYACCCGTMFKMVFTAEGGGPEVIDDANVAADDEKGAAVVPPQFDNFEAEEIACSHRSHRPVMARRPVRDSAEIILQGPWIKVCGSFRTRLKMD